MQDFQPNKQFGNPINFGAPANQALPNTARPATNQGFGNTRQAEDMFAELDTTTTKPEATARPLAPAGNISQMPAPDAPNRMVGMEMIEQPPKTRGSFKYLLMGVATLVVILVIGIFAYQVILKPRLQNNANTVDLTISEETANQANSQLLDEELSATQTEETPLTEEPLVDQDNLGTITEEAEPVILERPADSDGDGLSDAQEDELKTNPLAIDSDDDGLTDKDEVQIYNTNPLDPDTDGDTYLDGQEVKSGYNPNGAGKLFDATTITN
ncbi:MAG: hypothetical protein V1765_01965 [bacterium]